MHRFYFILLVLIAVSAGQSTARAQNAAIAPVPVEQYFDQAALDAFYAENGDRPVWLEGRFGRQDRAEAVIAILKQAWTQGLNPDIYRAEQLEKMLADLPREERLSFDRLLSDSVVRYATDLTGMRGIRNEKERAAKYWRTPMSPGEILNQVALNSNPAKTLKALEPQGNLYQTLSDELIALAAKTGEPAIIKAAGAIKPGQSYSVIPQIRARLIPQAAQDPSKLYDDDLGAAVMSFQKQNGLVPDGIISTRTLKALNRSIESRMMQVIVNMERLRWMEPGRPDRYVLVNIPSTTLWAMENGETALEMPVIVGKSARQTYSFRTEITGVRFNPTWTAPQTIKVEDFLPLLRQHPTVLAERGIRITYKGQEIDPTKVPWETVTPRDLTQVKMIQPPSKDNPLGRVRVIMENPYDIYLHDTNHREMFKADERTLSSGCIRVAEPEKLADFILKQNSGWGEAKMNAIFASGQTRNIMSDKPMPVYITYQSVWLDSSGTLIYGPDIYGQDTVLGNILKKSNEIPRLSEKN